MHLCVDVNISGANWIELLAKKKKKKKKQQQYHFARQRVWSGLDQQHIQNFNNNIYENVA